MRFLSPPVLCLLFKILMTTADSVLRKNLILVSAVALKAPIPEILVLETLNLNAGTTVVIVNDWVDYTCILGDIGTAINIIVIIFIR